MRIGGSHGRKRRERARRSGGFLLDSAVEVTGLDFENKLLRSLEQQQSTLRGVSNPMQRQEDGTRSSNSPAQSPSSHSSRTKSQRSGKSGKSRASEDSGQYNPPWSDHTPKGKKEREELEEKLLKNASQDDPANVVSLVQTIAASRDAHVDSRIRHGQAGVRSFSAVTGEMRPMAHPQGIAVQKQKIRSASTGPSTDFSTSLDRPPAPIPTQAHHFSVLPVNTSSLQGLTRTSPFRLQQPGPKITVYPTEGTKARVAKAKQYIELKYHYIALVTAVPKDETNYLVRHYNPLQTLRNRRIRNRLGLGTLDLTPWEDADAVYQWTMACVDALSKSFPLTGGGNGNDININTHRYPHLPSPPPVPSSVDTKPKSKPKRSRIVQPTELFADFYWMEELGGRPYLEDREGTKLYPSHPLSFSEASRIREEKTPVISLEPSHGAPTPAEHGMIEVSQSGEHSDRDRRRHRQYHLGALWGQSDGSYRSSLVKGHGGSQPRSEYNLSMSDNGRWRGSRELTRPKKSEYMPANAEPSTSVPGRSQKRNFVPSSGLGITIGIGGGNISPETSSAEDSDDYSRKQLIEAPTESSMESRPRPVLVDETKSPNAKLHAQKSADAPLRRHMLGIESRILDQRPKRDSYERFHHSRVHHLRNAGRKHHPVEGPIASGAYSESDQSEVSDGGEEGSKHKKQPSVAIPKAIGDKLKSNIGRGRDKLIGRDHGDQGEEGETLQKHPQTKQQLNDDDDNDGDNEAAYESANVTRSPTPIHLEDSSLASKLKNLDRGRPRKSSKDDSDGIGQIWRRRMSPTKRLFGRRDSDLSFDGEKVEDASDKGSRKGDTDREEEGERRKGGLRPKDPFKKAKEKVGSRVERIKHEVGDFLSGAQSLLSSNNVSPVGSLVATEDEAEMEESSVKNKKSRESLDIEHMPENLKTKPSHRRIASISNAPSMGEIQTEALVRRNSSANSEIPPIDETVVKRSRRNSKAKSDTSSPGVSKDSLPLRDYVIESAGERGQGRLRLKREGSRLAEEYIAEDAAQSAIRQGASSNLESKPPENPTLLLHPTNISLHPIDIRENIISRRSHGGQSRLPPVYILRGQQQQARVNKKDLMRMRALLLSTGTLAHGVARRSSHPSTYSQGQNNNERQAVSSTTAAQASEACRTISKQINSVMSILSNKLDAFQDVTVPSFHSQIADINKEISHKLIPLVQTTADDADVLNVELSTTHVLNVKKLNDEVNQLVRKRRRTALKWVRRGGFVLLEWVVLGVMWWVWLVVVAIRIVRGCLKGVWTGVRWMLWM